MPEAIRTRKKAPTAEPETPAAAPAPREALPPPPPAPSPAPPAEAPPAAASARYRVWAHGTLQRDGRTHRPGEELVLPVDVGDRIVCLERL